MFWKWEESGAKVSSSLELEQAGKGLSPGASRKEGSSANMLLLELGPPKLQDDTFVSQAAKFVVLHYSSLRSPGYSVFWALSQS